jgi:hypothetical protein
LCGLRSGREVGTTREHPFFVRSKGWVPARELQEGDLFSTHEGRWVAAEGVYDTGEYGTVYNLRVAEYHTYFVGSREWGFSVWAHNADQAPIAQFDYGKIDIVEVYNKLLGQHTNPVTRESVLNRVQQVEIALPGVGMNLNAVTASPYSYANYAIVDVETKKVTNTGFASKGMYKGSASSIETAITERCAKEVKLS